MRTIGERLYSAYCYYSDITSVLSKGTKEEAKEATTRRMLPDTCKSGQYCYTEVNRNVAAERFEGRLEL